MQFDVWKILAGVAIFLLGIQFLEESLQQLAGRRFKLFLKKQTSNKVKAIGGGAIVTGVLQSSSLVSLMVLAFVGAGIIKMQNALAVILGANLGTTLSSWIVVLVGFKMNIENIALPIAGIGGLGYVLFNKQTAWYNWSRFLLGFGFLFVGLGYMKSGIEDLVMNVDLSRFEKSPVIVFFLLGFILTTLIQSSSATVAITLSALHAGAIGLYESTAVILGSEIGTTIKLFIASVRGVAAKRRVALGNFIFNVINVSLFLIFLSPINYFITGIVGIGDPLLALVFFQSLVNVIGILLFYPFLNVFGNFLENRFKKTDDETLFIHKVDARESSMALYALAEENRHFLAMIHHYALSCFKFTNQYKNEMGLSKRFADLDLDEKYLRIKFVYGEIHSYYIQLQKTVSVKEENERLDQLMSSVRNAMYAAKSLKDSLQDKTQLEHSSNDVKYAFYQQTASGVKKFCDSFKELLVEDTPALKDKLATLYRSVIKDYTSVLQHLYREGTAGHVNETEITTMLNFNREIFTAFKSVLFAIKDFRLNKEQSMYFEDLPGFIR